MPTIEERLAAYRDVLDESVAASTGGALDIEPRKAANRRGLLAVAEQRDQHVERSAPFGRRPQLRDERLCDGDAEGQRDDRSTGGADHQRHARTGRPGQTGRRGADGKAGPMTRAAIRAYQQSAGMPADGFPSHALLKQLKSGS